MTNALLASEGAGPAEAKAAPGRLALLLSRLPAAIAFYGILTILVLLLLNLPNATDYVGADNDDVMRLIEVRDLLGGQGWFDLMQYRLGLGDGTLMHWSRLIDVPLANLISTFDLFLPHERAEALALTVWPLSLSLALLAAMGLAGRRIGGIAVMHVSLGLTALFMVTGNRFLPGSIDHHNVQQVLIATMAAMLVDPARRAPSFFFAGAAAALAVAIGAETVPHVAVASMIVALLWGWHGPMMARAARAYCLGLVGVVSAAFFATIPPSRYGAVTCDNLSLGFYSIIAAGGLGLMAATFLPARCRFSARLGALGLVGAAVAGTAVLIAPKCLGNPLADLDPLVVRLWLSNVTEARSMVAFARLDPSAWGAFYGVGAVAFAIAIFFAIEGRRVETALILAALIGVSWLVAALQVRGAAFANLLGILPFSLLLIDLRRFVHANPQHMGASFLYLCMGFAALPSAWAMAGLVATEGVKGIVERLSPKVDAGNTPACIGPAALATLAALPPTTVAAPVEFGVSILRYTGHRVLTAPYHRNQGGILTEIYIGLSKPKQAEAFLRGAGVGVLAFCRSDWQTMNFAKLEPQGLYGQLTAGNIPGYLEPVAGTETVPLQLYRVRP